MVPLWVAAAHCAVGFVLAIAHSLFWRTGEVVLLFILLSNFLQVARGVNSQPASLPCDSKKADEGNRHNGRKFLKVMERRAHSLPHAPVVHHRQNRRL
jgi:hypothetical protein